MPCSHGWTRDFTKPLDVVQTRKNDYHIACVTAEGASSAGYLVLYRQLSGPNERILGTYVVSGGH